MWFSIAVSPVVSLAVLRFCPVLRTCVGTRCFLLPFHPRKTASNLNFKENFI